MMGRMATVVEWIMFNNEKFNKEDENNLFDPITNNTIVLCSDYKAMDMLANEIINTINGAAEYNDYSCDQEDVGNAKLVLSFGLQRLIDINGQRITIALEPAIIYKAQGIDDIWFFNLQSSADGAKCVGSIYPMLVFKGSNDVWNAGLDEVYKTICNGQYGTYNGKWVDLHAEEGLLV